jgi:hypothetical protein
MNRSEPRGDVVKPEGIIWGKVAPIMLEKMPSIRELKKNRGEEKLIKARAFNFDWYLKELE